MTSRLGGTCSARTEILVERQAFNRIPDVINLPNKLEIIDESTYVLPSDKRSLKKRGYVS